MLEKLTKNFRDKVQIYVSDGILEEWERNALMKIAKEEGIPNDIAERYIIEELKKIKKDKEEAEKTIKEKEEEDRRKREIFSTLLKFGGSIATVFVTIYINNTFGKKNNI